MSDASPVPADADSIHVGRRVAQGSGLMMVSRFLSRLIDLATMLTLTRMLVPADFGLVAIAMTLVNVVEAAFDLPINQALLRLSHITRAHYDAAFTLGLLRGVILFAVFLLAAPPFASLYDDTRLLWLVVALGLAPMFRGLISPKLAEFQKELSFWRDFALEIAGKLATLAVCTGVALLTSSYWAIAVGTIIYPIVTTLYSYYLAPYRPRLSMAEFGAFYHFVGWASAGSIVGSISWQFDRLLLGKLQTVSQLGLFTTASDLSNMPFNTLFMPMIRPLLAAFTHVRADPPRLADSYQRASSAIVSVGLPILIGVSLLAEPVVFVVLGRRWIDSADFVRWLSLSWIPALFTFAAVPLVMALGKTKLWFYRNSIDLSIRLPVAVVGVLNFGFMGVIFARFLSEFLTDILCMLCVRRLLGVSVWQQLVVCSRAVFAAFAMTVAVKPLLGVLPPPTGLTNALLSIAVAAVVGGGVYTAVLLATWMASNRPDGLERMAWDLLMERLTFLRRPERRSAEPRPLGD